MNLVELIVSIALVFLVVGVATFFVLRQRRTLHELRATSDISPDERRFVRQQVARRLLGAFLLALFGALLVGWFFVEPQLAELTPPKGAEAPELAEAAKKSLPFFVGYWIVALLVLLALLALAAFDRWATARFGLRRQRQLEQDRHALFRDEAARLRQRRAERN